LTTTTKGAELLVSQLVKLAEAGVERVAANASLFAEKTGLNTLNTIAEVTKPGALVSGSWPAKSPVATSPQPASSAHQLLARAAPRRRRDFKAS
jgi:hypothetical protein